MGAGKRATAPSVARLIPEVRVGSQTDFPRLRSDQTRADSPPIPQSARVPGSGTVARTIVRSKLCGDDLAVIEDVEGVGSGVFQDGPLRRRKSVERGAEAERRRRVGEQRDSRGGSLQKFENRSCCR